MKPPPVPVESPPVVRSLGLCQVPSKGWCVVYLESRADRITAREVLEGPGPKGLAIERLKLEVVRRLLMPSVAGGGK